MVGENMVKYLMGGRQATYMTQDGVVKMQQSISLVTDNMQVGALDMQIITQDGST
jgi:hypothetical protein